MYAVETHPAKKAMGFDSLQRFFKGCPEATVMVFGECVVSTTTSL